MFTKHLTINPKTSIQVKTLKNADILCNLLYDSI